MSRVNSGDSILNSFSGSGMTTGRKGLTALVVVFRQCRLDIPSTGIRRLGATDLGSARSVPAFWENSKVVPPIERRADGKMQLEIFRVFVAIDLGGSTDLARPRSVAPNTEGIAWQKRLP